MLHYVPNKVVNIHKNSQSPSQVVAILDHLLKVLKAFPFTHHHRAQPEYVGEAEVEEAE